MLTSYTRIMAQARAARRQEAAVVDRFQITPVPDGYQIRECGITLPMVFATVEAAQRHIALLQPVPLTAEEIRHVVRQHAQEEAR